VKTASWNFSKNYLQEECTEKANIILKNKRPIKQPQWKVDIPKPKIIAFHIGGYTQQNADFTDNSRILMQKSTKWLSKYSKMPIKKKKKGRN
jgi:hypothetical protein